MQTSKKLNIEKSTDPYVILSERAEIFLPGYAHRFSPVFFHDVAFYIKKRMNSLIDEAGIRALLEGALIRLEERLASAEDKLLDPAAYYRTIIRNLVNDYYRDMLSDERFLISQEAVALISASGFPREAVKLLDASVSTKPITLRTLRGKLKSIFDAADLAQNQRQYFQREAIQIFRFQISRPLEKTRLENIPAEEAGTRSLSQLGDCLQQLRKRDRDLVRMKSGLDGISRSFEEIGELFQAASTSQVRNRYYYLLKGLRSCLESKGYRFG